MIKAKKSLGQNFLVDENILNKIVSIVKIKNNNLLVICADFGLIIDDYKFENSNRQLKNGMFLK